MREYHPRNGSGDVYILYPVPFCRVISLFLARLFENISSTVRSVYVYRAIQKPSSDWETVDRTYIRKRLKRRTRPNFNNTACYARTIFATDRRISLTCHPPTPIGRIITSNHSNFPKIISRVQCRAANSRRAWFSNRLRIRVSFKSRNVLKRSARRYVFLKREGSFVRITVRKVVTSRGIVGFRSSFSYLVFITFYASR